MLWFGCKGSQLVYVLFYDNRRDQTYFNWHYGTNRFFEVVVSFKYFDA